MCLSMSGFVKKINNRLVDVVDNNGKTLSIGYKEQCCFESFKALYVFYINCFCLKILCCGVQSTLGIDNRRKKIGKNS